MRADFHMQRLFVDAPIAADQALETTRTQVNYLANVLRMKEGDQLLIFNGRDGEWHATVSFSSRKKILLKPTRQTRSQPPDPDLWLLFAPLKVGRLDYLVQKAVEMGAGRILPVLTQHTQVHKLNIARMRANVIEAAEQCGILAVPKFDDVIRLDQLLSTWPDTRRLLFCDEAEETHNPLSALQSVKEKHLALLIGPEGGFSKQERQYLRSQPFVSPLALGPRILRADTAVVAAMAVLQATIGDWR